jgi:hypothetical protein
MKLLTCLVLLAFRPVTLAAADVKISIDTGMGMDDTPPLPSDGPVPAGTDGKPLSPHAAAFKARMEAARAAPQPHWSDDYEAVCQTIGQVSAESYPINHLDEPEKLDAGIRWAALELDSFFDEVPYPGGFSASEKGFRILRTDVESLNGKVRKWVEDPYNKNQKSILVMDGVAFFAPGTVLELLPLFVGEEGECDGAFEDMRRYGRDVGGERVSGGIMGKSEIGNSVMVQFRLEKLVKKEGRKKEGKDEL